MKVSDSCEPVTVLPSLSTGVVPVDEDPAVGL